MRSKEHTNEKGSKEGQSQFHNFGHRIGLARKHVRDHRRFDRAGTDGIDADTARRIFNARAFGEAQHSMLGALVKRASRKADKTAHRRTVHNSARPLLLHNTQLVFHVRLDVALVDHSNALKTFDRLVCCVTWQHLGDSSPPSSGLPAWVQCQFMSRRTSLSPSTY